MKMTMIVIVNLKKKRNDCAAISNQPYLLCRHGWTLHKSSKREDHCLIIKKLLGFGEILSQKSISRVVARVAEVFPTWEEPLFPSHANEELLEPPSPPICQKPSFFMPQNPGHSVKQAVCFS